MASRFQYPYFATMNWFALDWYLRRIWRASGGECDDVASYPERSLGLPVPPSTDALWPAGCACIWPAERAGLVALHAYLRDELAVAVRDVLRDAHTALDLPFSLAGSYSRLRQLETYLSS